MYVLISFRSVLFFFFVDVVSLIIEDSDELPVIGKVLKVDTEELWVEYWRGGWETKWRPWRERGKVWRDQLPKRCVLLAFQLNQDNKLPTKIVNELKEIYGNV